MARNRVIRGHDQTRTFLSGLFKVKCALSNLPWSTWPVSL
jgi:hypothetical protein